NANALLRVVTPADATDLANQSGHRGDFRTPRRRAPSHWQTAGKSEIVLAPQHGHFSRISLLQLQMILTFFPSTYSAQRSKVAGLLVACGEATYRTGLIRLTLGSGELKGGGKSGLLSGQSTGTVRTSTSTGDLRINLCWADDKDGKNDLISFGLAAAFTKPSALKRLLTVLAPIHCCRLGERNRLPLSSTTTPVSS